MKPRCFTSALIFALMLVVGTACSSGVQPTPATSQSAAPASTAVQSTSAAGQAATSAPTTQSAVAAPTGEIKLGLVNVFSGPVSDASGPVINGILAAAEMQNKRGGLFGKKIVFAKGNAPDSAAALAETERVITQEGVKLLVGAGVTYVAMAGTEVAEKHKLPWIEMAGVSSSITNRGFKYTFKNNVDENATPKAAMELAAKVIAPRMGVAVKDLTVAIANIDDEFSTNAAKAAEAQVKQAGLKLLWREQYSAKSADFSSLIIKLRRDNPDVFIWSDLAQPVAFVRQMKEQGYSPKNWVDVGGALGQQAFMDAMGPDVNGLIGPAYGLVPKSLSPDLKALSQEYVATYTQMTGKEAPFFSYLGFAPGWMWFHTILPQAGSLDADTVRQTALKVDAPLGSAPNGWGYKFKGQDTDAPGQNERSFNLLGQWRKGSPEIAHPLELAEQDLIVPLPKWGQRN